MKPIEPILRILVNNYFAKNKQSNMDSESARNSLVRHIADTIPPPILNCSSDALMDYPEHTFDKNSKFMSRNHYDDNYQ